MQIYYRDTTSQDSVQYVMTQPTSSQRVSYLMDESLFPTHNTYSFWVSYVTVLANYIGTFVSIFGMR